MKPSDDELLSAYLDGVAELTPEERRRVEGTLSELDVDGTRAMIDQLRALPHEGSEPDWRALERRIASAVDEARPPWWRRWLVLAPIGAVALAAAALLVFMRQAPERTQPAAPVAVITPDAAIAAAVAAPAPAAQATEVWIDGTFVDVSDVDPDLLDEPAELPTDVADDDALLPAGDLRWVDQLDDRALERAEHWLERKKS